MIDNLYQFRETLRQQNVYFSFVGPFSQTLMEDITEALRGKLQFENAPTGTIMNVFAVVVELVQNIIYYSAETLDIAGENAPIFRFGTLVIGYEAEQYFILCGNLMNTKDVFKLRDRLTQLRTMTRAELKAYYKEQRRQQPDDESRGAGLGFIEIARKVSQPLEFDFQPIDDQRSFFSIKAVIVKES